VVWNRNPCGAVLRVSHWHMREVSVAASGGHLFIRPGCLRSLQALSQEVPEHERCEDD